MKGPFPKLKHVRVYVSFVVIDSVLLYSGDCHAYIDPNAAGWLFQLLFPVLVAIAGLWTVFRQRIGALWNRLFKRSAKRNEP